MLTEEQIENFPVKHLSPSAILNYLSDRQSFFKRYIRLEFDKTRTPAAVEGSCCHKVVEGFWKSQIEGSGFDWKAATNDAITFFLSEQNEEFKLVDWGKTGSPEKSEKTVRYCMEAYQAELPDYIPVSVEDTWISDFEDLDGSKMPIPIKGKIDLIVGHDSDENRIGIVDHKFLGFTEDKVKPSFEVQACAYFFIVRKHLGINPYSMVFDQWKKSANRDGSPQRVPVEVIFTPKLLNRFCVLYNRLICELSGRPLIDNETNMMAFLPNPSDQFNAEESWLDFCEEVDNGKKWTMDAVRKIQENKYSEVGVTPLEL